MVKAGVAGGGLSQFSGWCRGRKRLWVEFAIGADSEKAESRKARCGIAENYCRQEGGLYLRGAKSRGQ
jgi:hypothetical protein